MIAPALLIDVEHDADVGAARRAAVVLAGEARFGEERTSDVALVVTELAQNIVKYGSHGGVLLSLTHDATARTQATGLVIQAWDRGQGMDVAESLTDGTSTSGTRGVGLGAVARIASKWDAYAMPGMGSVVAASIYPRAGDAREHSARRFDAAHGDRVLVGAVCLPYPGEQVCGDGWDARTIGDTILVAVCDGLGHGVGACEATAAVLTAFRNATTESPATLVDVAHGAARPTRGVAATFAKVDLARGEITVAGVGNVTPWIVRSGELKQLVTQHGTLGQTPVRAREELYEFPRGSSLVIASDGLKSRLDLSNHPGLFSRHPSTIAATLWRDFARGKDDATVVVLREAT
ncbi:MAG TPA: SpoIIE family protein phosphatase [Kofleriaceae bacterium]